MGEVFPALMVQTVGFVRFSGSVIQTPALVMFLHHQLNQEPLGQSWSSFGFLMTHGNL